MYLVLPLLLEPHQKQYISSIISLQTVLKNVLPLNCKLYKNNNVFNNPITKQYQKSIMENIYFQNIQCQALLLYYLNQYMKKGNLNQHYICQGCKQSFGTNKIPRLLPICGHTLCESCITILMETNQNGGVVLKCVIDGKQMQFEDRQLSNFPKNFAMLKTLQKRQMKTQPSKAQAIEVKSSQKIDQPQTLKTQESESLLQVTKSSAGGSDNQIQAISVSEQRLKIGQQKQDMKQQQMCLIHSRPLQIICLKDSVMICSNCALFGEHRNHVFKSIVDVKKDINLREAEFIQVIDQKEQLQKDLGDALSTKQVDMMLLTKKQVLTKQIQEYFDKLAKRLKQQQKKLYLRLQEIITVMQKSFTNDADRVKKGFVQFSQWERKTLDYLNILEGQDLQQKLKVLDYDKVNTSPIDEGYKIIDQIQKNKVDTVSHWNDLLNKFQMNFKSQETEKFINLITINPPSDEQDPIDESIIHENSETKTVQTKSFQPSKIQLPLEKSHSPNIKNFSLNDDLLIQMEQNIPSNFNIPNIQFDTSMNADYQMCEFRDISKIERRQSSFIGQSNSFAPYQFIVPKSPSSVNKGEKGFEAKKKLKPVKVPPKYQKTMESLINDSLDVLDFTNSQLGNQDISLILQHLKNKKIKNVKLIRCKLTDDILPQLWNSMSKVISLNLSQNLFSDRIIDSFLDNINKLPCLKTLTLSQNKINQRNVKFRVQQAKKYDVTISL